MNDENEFCKRCGDDLEFGDGVLCNFCLDAEDDLDVEDEMEFESYLSDLHEDEYDEDDYEMDFADMYDDEYGYEFDDFDDDYV
jgi:hypothetical protein